MQEDKQERSMKEKDITFRQFAIFWPTVHLSNSIIINQNQVYVGNPKSIRIQTNCLIGLKERLITTNNQQYFQIALMGFPKRNKFMRGEHRYIEVMAKFYLPNDTKIRDSISEAFMAVITKRKVKKFMIYFNPVSGSNSLSHLNKVVDFIGHTNFTYDLITTTGRGHCQEHLKHLKVQDYCGVVIISGDGLMHQFLNSRVKISVTHVPAGSGNAFAKTQTSIAGQQCKAQQAIFLAIKGKETAFNVTKYELEKVEEPIYSFLSLQWANLADIDMNSEFLRFIGGLRFDVYGAWTVVRNKSYRGKIYYSDKAQQIPPLNVDISNHPDFQSVEDNFLNLVLCNIPYLSDKYKFAPSINIQQKLMDLQYIPANVGRWQYAKYLLSSENGAHFDQKKQNPKQGFNFVHRKIKCFRLQPLGEDIGILGIDGERYQAQKIQGSISQLQVISFV